MDGRKDGSVFYLFVHCSMFDVISVLCFCCNPPLFSLFPPHVVVLSPHSSFFISVSISSVHSSSFFLSSSLQSMMSTLPSIFSFPSPCCVCVCTLTSSVTRLCPSPPFPLRHPTLLHFFEYGFRFHLLAPTYLSFLFLVLSLYVLSSHSSQSVSLLEVVLVDSTPVYTM